jgi:methyl-accepting chemotaxis protein
MIGHVRAGAENVNLGANEIAAGNTDLSQRTEEQAAALVQTASSMDHMTASVRTNADCALDTARLAQQAADIAARGSDVVRTMGEISSRSRQRVEAEDVARRYCGASQSLRRNTPATLTLR